MADRVYKWTDDPMLGGVKDCDPDVVNECLMSLKYENTSNAIQNMYTTGQVETQTRAFEQLKAMKHSTFDLSKFTRVGSPTITDDGVASGFSNENYLTIPKEIINSLIGHKWKIEYELKTKPVADGTALRYLFGIDYAHNKTNPINLGFFNSGYNWFANLLLSDGSRTINFHNTLSNTNFGSMKGYLEFTGSLYINAILQETDTSWKISQVSSELSIAEATEDLRIGYNLTSGSIDLKQFSITVDGKEVFSGNKTGIDVIKPDNYEVVGSPVISDDGVASGFKFSPETDLKSNIDFSNINSFVIEGRYYNTTGSGLNQAVFELYDTVNNITKMRFGVQTNGTTSTFYYPNSDTTVTNNHSFKTIVLNTWNYFKIVYDGTNVSVYINDMTTSVYSVAVMKSWYQHPMQLWIGLGSNQQAWDGSIDLNFFKIYVDGNLVYQPCLKIPYTLSKTGSKIVDVAYRDRVIDLYEQQGQAGYYTIQEDRKENFTKVGSPTIVNGIASGFSESNYLQCLANFATADSWEILGKFTTTSDISSAQTILSSLPSVGPIYFYLNGGYLSLMFTSINGSTADILGKYNIPVSTNTSYWYKLLFTGTQYKLQLSTDGTNYAGAFTPVSSTTKIYSGVTGLSVGSRGQSAYFLGSIDLNAFKIYVDDELVYTPYIEPNFTLPMGEIYGMIEDSKKGYQPPLLSTMWSDHLLNDMSWLRADTFSWQDENSYSLAYNELLAEYNNSSSFSETEGSITFKRTPKGYKIALADQETAIAEKYATHGIAWYYILDTENKRFKLPRTKFGFEGVRTSVGLDIEETVPNINATFTANQLTTPKATGAISVTQRNVFDYHGDLSDNNAANTYKFNANDSCSSYQDNAPVQERATQMYLYFYVGEFTKSAESQTAGLKAELLNGKLDVLAIKRYPVEVSDKSLMPSWYVVYSDGWCEQGGSVISNADILVTLLKPYKNTNFTAVVGGGTSNGAWPYCYIKNNANIYVGSRGTTGYSGTTVFWQTSGYIA